MSIQTFETRPTPTSVTPGGLKQTEQEHQADSLGAAAGDYEYSQQPNTQRTQAESDAQVFELPIYGNKVEFYRNKVEDVEAKLADFNLESARIEQQLAALRRDKRYLQDMAADLSDLSDTSINPSRVAASSLKTQSAIQSIDHQLSEMTGMLTAWRIEIERMYEQLLAPAKAKHEDAETKDFERMSERNPDTRTVGSVAMGATILRLPSF
jgi:hypothetical protein